MGDIQATACLPAAPNVLIGAEMQYLTLHTDAKREGDGGDEPEEVAEPRAAKRKATESGMPQN